MDVEEEARQPNFTDKIVRQMKAHPLIPAGKSGTGTTLSSNLSDYSSRRYACDVRCPGDGIQKDESEGCNRVPKMAPRTSACTRLDNRRHRRCWRSGGRHGRAYWAVEGRATPSND